MEQFPLKVVLSEIEDSKIGKIIEVFLKVFLTFYLDCWLLNSILRT